MSKDEKIIDRCLSTIKTTAEYIIANPFDGIPENFEDQESKFYGSGADVCFVRIKDKLIFLNTASFVEDAKFVLDNINNINYYLVVGENYDTVVGNLYEYCNSFDNENVWSYEYKKFMIAKDGNFTEHDVREYFNSLI